MTKLALKDICSILHSGKSIRATEVHKIGNYPVLGGNGLRGYTDIYNFDGECAVIGRQGAACGNVRYFCGRAFMTEHAVIAQASSAHNARFLAYLLSTQALGRLSGQSAQPGLSVRILGEQEYDMPTLDEQNRTASLLGTIDDKITLNRRINDHLAA